MNVLLKSAITGENHISRVNKIGRNYHLLSICTIGEMLGIVQDAELSYSNYSNKYVVRKNLA